MNGETQMISVIVPSHRSAYMRELAEILREQIEANGPAEAIVVTDYNHDALAQRYPGIRWVYNQSRSIPVKRNVGLSRARGTVAAFVDDDCRPHQDWLAKGREYLESHPEVAGVEGLTTIERIEGSGANYREFKRLEQRGFRTNNVFYKTESIREVGGFDERFSVQREDIDLAFSLLEKGHKIEYCHAIRVEHRYRPEDTWDLLKNCWNRRFDPLLYRKHPRLYRQHIRTPFPLSIGAVLAVHAATIAAAARAPAYWAPAAGLDVVCVTVLALRRAGYRPADVAGFLRQTIAFAVSPFVLVWALVVGSVRARRFLIV